MDLGVEGILKLKIIIETEFGEKHVLVQSRVWFNITALIFHSKENNHNFNFNSTTILAFESNLKSRKIREVIEIWKMKNSVNFNRDNKVKYQLWLNFFETPCMGPYKVVDDSPYMYW